MQPKTNPQPAPLKWTEIPYRPHRPMNCAATASVFGTGKRRIRILISAEAVRKLKLKADMRVKVLRAGLCLAFLPTTTGLKAVTAKHGEPGRLQILTSVPDDWTARLVRYNLAMSGDDYYLEPVP